MQAEALQAVEATGVVDKLLGPSGGLALALLGLAAVVYHHIKVLQKHGERLEEKDAEIRRLAEARVEEAQGEARELVAKMAEMDAAEAKRWAKLARLLALTEPLGVVLTRLEMMVKALTKRSGGQVPQQQQQPPPISADGEDQGVSMF